MLKTEGTYNAFILCLQHHMTDRNINAFNQTHTHP